MTFAHRRTGIYRRGLVGLVFMPGVASVALGQDFDTTPRAPDWLAGECVEIDDGYEAPRIERDCRVMSFGKLGHVGATDVYYATYRLLVVWPEIELSLADTAATALNAPPYNYTAVVVFHAVGDSLLRPVWAEMNDGWLGISWYELPRILTTPVGTMLTVPLRFSGTGFANDDRYFIWSDGEWRRLDTSSWASELARELPAGHAVWKGVVLDLERMRAQTPVWRSGQDANCCPSGGHAEVEFELAGDRLVIRRVIYTGPAADSAP